MNVHISAQAVLIAWLALSGLAIVWRGLTGSTRHYTISDAIFGAAEIAFLIWLVTVASR